MSNTNTQNNASIESFFNMMIFSKMSDIISKTRLTKKHVLLLFSSWIIYQNELFTKKNVGDIIIAFKKYINDIFLIKKNKNNAELSYTISNPNIVNILLTKIEKCDYERNIINVQQINNRESMIKVLISNYQCTFNGINIKINNFYILYLQQNDKLIIKNVFIDNNIQNENYIISEKDDDDKDLINCIITFIFSKETGKVIDSDIESWIKHINDMNSEIPFVCNYNENIDIYIVKMDIKETVVKNSNPEYTKYKSELDNIKKENLGEAMMLQTKYKTIPEEFIEHIHKDKKLICTLINQTCKSFNSLYLPKLQNDYIKLCLDQFENNKQKYKEFGICRKLNFLLSGLPGCGKSSTIIAIATYLKRDIYYLSLNGIETNQQLKDMFDEIMKNKAEKAIIVFEDIDSQSNIVKCRETEVKDTQYNLIDTKDDKLDLSYFLNILDGVLSYEDSIIILTTNYIEHLDPAIYRTGRITSILEYKYCDKYQIQMIFKHFRGYDIPPHILNKIPEYKHSPASIIFYLFDHINIQIDNDDELMRKFYE